MKRERGFVAFIRAALDSDSVSRTVRTLKDVLKKGGEEAGEGLGDGVAKGAEGAGQKTAREVIAEMQREFDRGQAKLKLDLVAAPDNASRQQIRQQMREAERAFQQQLAPALEKARAAGELTENQVQRISRRLKDLGDDAPGQVGAVQQAFQGLKGFLLGFLAFLLVDFVPRIAASLFRVGAAAGETASKFATVFGDAREQMDGFVSRLANMAGMTRTEMRDLAGNIGGIVIALGMGRKEAADFSEQMIQAAADMASFNNADARDVSQALLATLRGEFDVVEKYGVALTAADVKTRALAETGKKNEEQLTRQEKAWATLRLTMEQAALQMGDLERTKDSLANRSREVAARLREMWETLAILLVPEFEKAVNNLAAWLNENEEFAADTVKNLAQVLSVLAQIAAYAGRVVNVTVQIVVLGLDKVRDLDRWFEQSVARPIQRAIGTRGPEGEILLDAEARRRDAERLRMSDEEYNAKYPLPKYTPLPYSGPSAGEAARVFPYATPGGIDRVLGMPRDPRTMPGTGPGPVNAAPAGAFVPGTREEQAAFREKAARDKAAREEAAKAAKEREAAARQEIADLQRLAALRGLNSQEVALLRQRQEELTAQLAAGNHSIEEEVKLRERLRDVQALLPLRNVTATPVGVGSVGMGVQNTGPEFEGRILQARADALAKEVELLARIATFRRLTADETERLRMVQAQLNALLAGAQGQSGVVDAANALHDTLTRLQDLMYNLPTLTNAFRDSVLGSVPEISSALGDLFAAIVDGALLSGQAMGSLASAAKGVGAAVIGGLAGGMAQYHEAQAAGKLAEGTWPPNPVAIASAAKHLLAASAFRALGAIVSKGASGGGGGGGGTGLRDTRDGSFAGVRDGQKAGQEIHIHFIGPGFHALNPEVQRVVHGANQIAGEVYGKDARIITHMPGR